MGDTWTKEQKEAINTRNCNLLVAAAAGSGKTAVLVERIIKMLTEGEDLVDIDKLLVVTFTNAAAAEMRERIGDAISKALEKNPHSPILQRQLSLLNRSNIMTIHSFCLNVIRSNYHLLDLDPGFRIADEAEISIIKDDIVSELLEDKYEQGEACYLDLVDAFASGKSDDAIKTEILKLYRFVMSGPWPEKWLIDNANDYDIKNKEELNKSKWVLSILADLKPQIDSIIETYKEMFKVCDENPWLIPYKETFELDYLGFKETPEAIKSGDIEKVYEILSKSKFSRIKNIKKADVEDETLKENLKAKRDEVKKLLGKLAEGIPYDNVEDIIAGIVQMKPMVECLAKLVIEFKEKFSEKKKEKNILDFNDIEHLCLRVLVQDGFGTDNPTPSAVAKEFKEKFVEVLVDEYQDSSSIQETIIDMVSRRTEENPNAFMVGDVKQSIYKFRQAKPELFLDKYNRYSEKEESLNRKILLYANFRSRKEVLASANYIFETLMSEKVGELEYDEKERLNLGIPYLGIEGNLSDDDAQVLFWNSTDTELHIFDKSGEKLDEEQVVVEESFENEEEDLEQAQYEGRIIAQRIKEFMSVKNGANYVVWDKSLKKYRKLKYKDIVILLRATKNWSAGIVEELGSVGIPVYADTGTGYFDTTEIRTIMSLLNIIDNPMQDIYLIAAMRSPIFSFTAEELGEIRLVNKEKYFYENIKTVCNGEFIVCDDIKQKCIYFLDKLNDWRERSEYTPIDELIWYLYTDTSYYGYVGAMPNGVQRQANLKILFQRAKQYEETSFKGVFNFINFIKRVRKSDSNDMGSAKILGENEDVVRIMSIHKSKGLEFPVVFVAGTGKQFNLMDLNNNILCHEKLGIGVDIVNLETQNKYTGLAKTAIKSRAKAELLSEEMRILYVALTRAREKLVIVGSVGNLEKKFISWYNAASTSEGTKIEPSKLLQSQMSFMDWIGMAMAKHPDGQIIRQGQEIINSQDLSKWEISTWRKSELISTQKVEIDEKEILDLEKEDVDISREILDRLNFRYKFEKVCNVPSNISVSDIKKKYMPQEEITLNLFKDEDVESFNLEIEENKDNKNNDNKVTKYVTDEHDGVLPSFMKKKENITALQKGTIMHFVMQHVDFDKISVSDIRKLVDKMVIKDLLTDEEAKVVNPYKISGFFKSDIGQRLLKARENGFKIYRELPFFREFKITDLYEDLDKDIYKDEMLRMQGIIDCFFEDENGVVLIDYKTDFVILGEEDKILDRYKIQIDLYANTLKRILGKDISEKCLYLFRLEKIVKY